MLFRFLFLGSAPGRQGVVFPSMFELLSHWAPPLERTKMTAVAFSGMSVGTFTAMVTCGLLAEHCGWPSIFYVYGNRRRRKAFDRRRGETVFLPLARNHRDRVVARLVRHVHQLLVAVPVQRRSHPRRPHSQRRSRLHRQKHRARQSSQGADGSAALLRFLFFLLHSLGFRLMTKSKSRNTAISQGCCVWVVDILSSQRTNERNKGQRQWRMNSECSPSFSTHRGVP